MILCEKEDLELAAKIVERYNALQRDEEEEAVEKFEEAIDEKATDLYGDEYGDYDSIPVPVELFHRMAAEVDHHKQMLGGNKAGLIATLGGTTTGTKEYGVSQDLKFEFRVALRAPEGAELTEKEIDEVVDCVLAGWSGTLKRESEALKAELADLRNRIENKPN